MIRTRPRLRHLALALGVLAVSFASPSRQAAAWDPSTTHQALVDAAMRQSNWHLEWMDTSQMQRGVFSPLALDASKLDPEMRGWIQETLRLSHRDLGVHPLGGPGACPGPEAPAVLQRFCVKGDRWELSAIGWVRLGVLAESQPRSRLFTHFTDLKDPSSEVWTDASSSRDATLRSQFSRSAGEPVAGVFAGSNYDGEHPSAIARLHDPTDPLGLPAMSRHLSLASLSASRAQRDHHLALGLLMLGANLHVITDASVPAHARGDAGAFMSPLSPAAGDRGDAMVEFVRSEYGLDLPEGEPVPRATSPLFGGFTEHLVGDDQREGLAAFTARHFLSAGTLGDPVYLDEGIDAREAAGMLVPQNHGLDEIEVEGAELAPWPAERGYLKNAAGRALAAFDRDAQGRTYLYLDRAVMRDAAAHLLPRTLETTTSVLNLVFTGHGEVRAMAAGLIHEVRVPATARAPRLHVLHEDPEGTRKRLQSVKLRAGQTQRLVGIPNPEEPEARIVLVFEWQTTDGVALYNEQTLEPSAG